MFDVGAAEQTTLKVFISYSRKDDEFAQDLLAGLEVVGFAPYLDKHDIAPGEPWEARLGNLIEAADAVVLVISPDSVGSERCAWEVNRTRDLKKRLLPIVWRSVEETQVPPRLKQLNYIFFNRPNSFGASLQALSKALRTDIEWVREHTRIGEAALRWDTRGRADALLLRGENLAAATDWLKAQPKYAQEPTLLMHEFIKAGEDGEATRSTIERQRLDQMTAALERENDAQREREKALLQAQAALRNAQWSHTAVGTLMLAIIAGLIGWINQSYLKEQLNWFMTMRPYMVASVRPYVLKPEAERALKPKDAFRECAKDCPEMIVVPSGTFTMGSPPTEKGRFDDEGPPQNITIAHLFAVSQFPVTFAEWDACVSVGGCVQVSDSDFGRGTKPVINVPWDYAKKYVTWLSRMTGRPYRLLSEAEWEYVARAGTTTVYTWGDEVGSGNANCNGCDNNDKWDGTSPVGSFKANAFGLFDMHGNVFQWVEDCYQSSYTGLPTDGSARTSGTCSRRVRRGGSWYLLPEYLRSANRDWDSTASRGNAIGFRVARTLGP